MRQLLWMLCVVPVLGCEPAPILVSLVDAGMAPPPAGSSSFSGGFPSTSGSPSLGAVPSSGAASGGGTSSTASSGLSASGGSSSFAASSRTPETPGALQGDLAFPVEMMASFFQVHPSGVTSEYRVWMGDVAGLCSEVAAIDARFAFNITFGILGGAQEVTPGTYVVVPRGAPLTPMQPYASLWGWWDPPSRVTFPAVTGRVEVSQASHAHVAGTFDVMMDRLDGSPPSALRGTFDTTCVQPRP